MDFENIKRVRLGKEIWLNLAESNLPVQEYLYQKFYEDTGVRKKELLHRLAEYGINVDKLDPGDLHVMYGAIEYDCNIIITANTDDFPKRIGRIDVVKPGVYYDLMINEL